jgi:regulator of RNase E activity RraA
MARAGKPREGAEADVAARLCRCSSSSVFDALDDLGIGRAAALHDLRVFGTRRRAAGPVETVQAEVRLERGYPVPDFSIGAQIHSTVPGSVLVIDLRGEPVSGWGALATRAAIRHGIAACVILGGARDVEEIDGLDFLLATDHVTPRTGKGRIRLTGRGAAVQRGETTIEAGEWIVVDRTGAVVIPRRAVADVAQRATALEEADAEFAQLLDGGAEFDQTARRLGHF